MIHVMPEFYYCGNRFMESDFPFIEKHMSRLSEQDQRIVAREYSNIYLRHFNAKEYREARRSANTYLYNYANENGIAARNAHETRAQMQKRIDSMVGRAKAAREESKPRIVR